MKPVRTALFAPGNKERVMAKALEAGADAVIFDLEDSVPVATKGEARVLVARAIEAAAARAGSAVPTLTVRTNAAASGWLAADLEAVLQPGLAAVFLPKVQDPEEVQAAAALLERLEVKRGIAVGTVAIVVMIESALGVRRCYEIVSASPRVATACIASARDGDLQNDLGCGWSAEGVELLYARSKVVLDTRAAGRTWPLDGVFSDLADEEGLVRDSRLSARLGYVGRTVIHPKQIALVRRAYAVPEAELAYCRRVVTEFEAVERSGTAAAITVEGRLVDYAMYERAKRVLELARLDG